MIAVPSAVFRRAELCQFAPLPRSGAEAAQKQDFHQPSLRIDRGRRIRIRLSSTITTAPASSACPPRAIAAPSRARRCVWLASRSRSNTVPAGGRETRNLAEIEIEGHDDPALFGGQGEYFLIR
jgi:hypothetical protein